MTRIMTSTFLQRIFALVLMVCLCSNLRAQEYKYEIGGMTGGACYMGDANKNSFLKGLNPALGAVFRYTPNFRWAVKADLMWGKVSGTTEGLANVFPNNAQATFSRSIVDLGGQMEFNFFPYSDKFAYLNAKRFSPYTFMGLGFTLAPGNGSTYFGPNISMGVGLKYKIANRINLGCEYSFRKLFGDGLDKTNDSNAFLDNPYHIGSSNLKNKDWYSFLLLSVTWDFGPRCQTCNNAKLDTNSNN